MLVHAVLVLSLQAHFLFVAHVFIREAHFATPPWPDGDHRRLHNGDCVHFLNDRPVHTSYKEPSPPPLLTHTHTHRQTGVHNRFLPSSLLRAVFYVLESRQTWWGISFDQTLDYLAGMSARHMAVGSVWFCAAFIKMCFSSCKGRWAAP